MVWFWCVMTWHTLKLIKSFTVMRYCSRLTNVVVEVEVDLVVVLQTLSRGKLTLTKLTFLSLSSAKPLEIGLWTLVAESLSRMGKPTRLNAFIFRVSSFFFLGLKSRLKSLIITLFYWFHLVTWWSKVNLHNVSGSYWIGSNYLTTVDFNLILFS